MTTLCPNLERNQHQERARIGGPPRSFSNSPILDDLLVTSNLRGSYGFCAPNAPKVTRNSFA